MSPNDVSMSDYNPIDIHLPEDLSLGRLMHEDLGTAIDDAVAKVERETGVAVQVNSATIRFSDEVSLTADAIRVFVGSHPWQIVMPVINVIVEWCRNAVQTSNRPLPPNPTVSVQVIGDNNHVEVYTYYLEKETEDQSE